MSRKVLIITYLFPPSGGVGPPRYAGYARHLTAMGFEVHVLTAKRPNTPLYDPGLLARVPSQTQVHRVFNPDLPYAFRDRIWKRIIGDAPAVSQPGATPREGAFRPVKKAMKELIGWVFNPDVQKFWVPFVLRRARRLIREEGIDTVILNTPPFSLHAVVPPLKREFPQLKWITEVRDDWLGYYLVNFDSARSDAKRNLAVKLEGASMRACDYVVAVTDAQREAIRRRYPDQPDSKFLCVPNGFDGDVFDGFQARRKRDGKMRLTYFGSLYATPPYDPVPFLEALDALPGELRDRIELRFVGRVAREAEALLQNRSVRIERLGFYPLGEAVKKLEETDYLLMIANEPSSHGGKLFDYLGSGLPILAITPPGEVRRVLEETRSGLAVEGTDKEGIQSLIAEAWARLEGGPSRFPEPDRQAAYGYERRQLAERLVRLTGMG